MKRLFLTVLFLILSCGLALSEDLYVTQNGTSPYNGTASYPFRVSDFNSSGNWGAGAGKISPGDYVYFSGTITSEVIPAGSGTSGNQIILDGYEAGNCDPINSECTGSALISSSNTNGIALTSPRHYLTIQDFRVKNVYEAIVLGAGSTHITVKRNYTDNNAGHSLHVAGDTYGNSPLYHIIIGGALGDGNYFNNAGSADGQGWGMIFQTHYGVISYNKFDNTNPAIGTEGLVLNSSHNMLVEKNYFYRQQPDNWETGTGLKSEVGDTSDNVIFRFNHVKDCVGYGIVVINNSANVYVYGNLVDGNSIGIPIPQQSVPTENVWVWSNIVVNNDKSGLAVVYYSSSSYHRNIYFYNNTIANNGSAPTDGYDAGLSVGTGSNILAKNNIFSNNLTSGGVDQEIRLFGGSLTIDYNHYYYSGGATVLTGISKGAHSSESNPQFVGSGNNPYALGSSSPAIDSGVNLSAPLYVNLSGGDSWFETNSGYSTITMNLNEGLNPSTTDWTTIPPTVNTVIRGVGDYGWDRGAYGYNGGGGGDSTPPSSVDWSDQPAADSTSQISMSMIQAHDNVSADGDIEYAFTVSSGSCGADYGSGGTSQSYTADDKTHSDSGLGTNKCYTYTGSARDEAENSASTSSISKYTLAATPGIPTFSVTDTTAQINNLSTVVNGNPTSNPSTQCAVYFASSSPADSNWDGKYLNSSGYPANETWLDCGTLNTITIGSSGGGYSPDITLAWECDNTTAEQSAGDDSASAIGGNETLSGGYAVFDDTSSNGIDNYSFDPSSQDIISGSIGTIFIKFRVDTWVDAVSLLAWYVDSNNYLFVETTSSNDILVTYKGQGSQQEVALTGSQISTGTDYILRYRWNTSAAYDHQITLFNTSFSQLDTSSTEDSLTAISGDGILYVGNAFDTAGSDISIDYIHIYNTYEDDDSQGSYGSPLTSDTYSVQIKAKNGNSVETSLGSAGTISISGSDTTAPEPDPSTWATEPEIGANLQIDMVATTSYDPSGLDYYFVGDPNSDSCSAQCGADFGAGITSSGEQEASSYTDTVTDYNSCYCYNVYAEDRSAGNNTTTASSIVTVYSNAATPASLTLGNATSSSIDITAIDVNGNPASNPTTDFYIGVGSVDGDWESKYVDTDGTPSETKVWMSAVTINAGITVSGMNEGTLYCFEAVARNGDGIETASSGENCEYTTGPIETVTHTGIGLTGIGINNAP